MFVVDECVDGCAEGGAVLMAAPHENLIVNLLGFMILTGKEGDVVLTSAVNNEDNVGLASAVGKEGNVEPISAVHREGTAVPTSAVHKEGNAWFTSVFGKEGDVVVLSTASKSSEISTKVVQFSIQVAFHCRYLDMSEP